MVLKGWLKRLPDHKCMRPFRDELQDAIECEQGACSFLATCGMAKEEIEDMAEPLNNTYITLHAQATELMNRPEDSDEDNDGGNEDATSEAAMKRFRFD